MSKMYDVIVTRDITERCAMVVEATNPVDAGLEAIRRAGIDTDLVWEQDDTPNDWKERYVTHCEEVSRLPCHFHITRSTDSGGDNQC